MSEADVAVIRASSAALSARDVDGMLARYAPDAVVVDHSGMGLGEVRGHDELRVYYQGIIGSTAALREDFRVVADHGDGRVVTDCELWARLPSDPTGNGVTAEYALAITVRDGLIQRLEIHPDAAAALAASERTASAMAPQGVRCPPTPCSAAVQCGS
jgi:ketosteroid isomerase-like protein